MKVLSLFDGISTGRLALENANIGVEKYYTSEIDEYAISISKYRYPDNIHLGDVTKWKNWNIDFSDIDLVIGGSPCQSFSNSGKMEGFDGASGLFFAYVDILNHIKSLNPNVKFLLENVKMKQEWADVISEMLGVQPIMINSSQLSAQSRSRYYWCNWVVEPVVEKSIAWKDIMVHNASDNYYYSEKGLQWLDNHSKKSGKKLKIYDENSNDKMQMIEASHFKNYSSQRFFGIQDVKGLRYITVEECERCQTLPDEWTKYGMKNDKKVVISNTQRYKAIGNGWTTDVITHIFKGLK